MDPVNSLASLAAQILRLSREGDEAIHLAILERMRDACEHALHARIRAMEREDWQPEAARK